ncbi:MAG TPA: hypothetical protein VFE92_14485 [Dermatophilaceae bacterium]|nr:hypothetical protein [Dermatophilaceae bacterium]
MSRLLTDQEITRQLENLPGGRLDGDRLLGPNDAPDFPAAQAATRLGALSTASK